MKTSPASTILRTSAGICTLCLAFALASCASDNPKRDSGVVLGALLGAAIGAAVGGEDGAAIGALVGAGAGGFVGAQLDAEDQRKHQAALGLAASRPPGGVTYWTSPQKQTSGQVARIGDMFTMNGKQCMQVEETITIQGEPHIATDTKCQDDGGLWRPQTT